MATIYIPYYDNGSWHILAADIKRARKVSRFWLHCGTIYGENAYTTEAGAQCYIGKRYSEANKFLYEVA